MAQNLSSSEIAKRTLLQLTKQSLPPTPENYQNAYNKIAGLKPDSPGFSFYKALSSVDERRHECMELEQKLDKSAKKKDWDSIENTFLDLLSQSGKNTESSVNWAALIRTLIKQLETSHKGITLSRKKDGLSRVLTNFGKNPEALAEKIEALTRSWGTEAVSIDVQPAYADNALPEASSSEAATTSTDTSTNTDNVVAQLQNMLTRTFDLALIPILKDAPEAKQSALDLLQKLRSTPSEQALTESAHALKDVLFKVETEQENQQDIHQALIGILNLLAKSMAELTVEDEWLKGQLTIVNDVLSKPVNILTLGNAESSLKELIHKQANLKPALHDAQDLIKKLAGTFISRLADMTETTDEYHQKIEKHQNKLADIDDIDELNGVLQNVLEDTRTMGLTVQRTREEFNDSQNKVTQAEKKIKELSTVLEYINDVANEDYLTGTLNRRGMDEALEREFSRADRHNTALCIAMMDIDHFKKLNDALGHSTGDEALTHFAKIIKEVKRPPDVVARYGGEEFILILPNTEQDDGVKVIERVQRQLTKQFFMHSEERVVITFSAGVAQRIGEETPEEIIPRADAALYAAKNAGRNRVMPANMQQSSLIKALQKK